MKFEKIYAKLLRPLAVIAAASVFAGGLIAVDPEPASAETSKTAEVASSTTASDQSSGDFLLLADSYKFYTHDDTPKLSVELSEAHKAMSGGLYFVDVQAQKSFYDMGKSNPYPTRIKRFYSDQSRSYKAVIATKKGPSTGFMEYPLESLEILAESNEITIERAPWEIQGWAPPGGHVSGTAKISSNSKDIPVVGRYTANQIFDNYSWSADFSPEYSPYLEEVKSGRVLMNPGVLSGFPAAEDEVVKYRVHVAKRNYNAKVVGDLENIQASDEFTVYPRKWGVKINKIDVVPLTGGKLQRVSPQVSTTRTISHSTLQQMYIENVDTGDIVYRGNPASSKGYYTPSVTLPVGSQSIRVHIAEKGQSLVTHISQLQNIRASSDGQYPVDVTPEIDPGYLKSSRFQNGANPSTGDCQQQCYGDPINSLNGELFENEVDLQIEGAMGLNFTRGYSSLRVGEDGPFGKGTAFSYDMALLGDRPTIDSSSYITVRQENGSTVAFSVFDEEGNGKNYVAPHEVKAALTKDGATGNYVFTRTITGDKFIFNSAGKLQSISDRLGNEVVLGYTGDQLTSVSNGVSTASISWLDGKISSVTSGSQAVTYEYSNDDRLTKVSSNRISGEKLYSYYPDGRVHKITHPNGGVYETSYDADGRAVSQIDPRGGTTTFEYQAGGYTLITLPNGEKTREKYDSTGKLLERSLAYGSAEQKVYSYGYSAKGEPVSETLPGGKSVARSYDSRGNLTSLTNTAKELYRFDYNDKNLLTRTTNPIGRSSTNEYSDEGVLLRSVDYDGAVTTYEHNSKGMLTSVKDPNGQSSGLSTNYSYNSSDLLESTVDTKGATTSISYDAARNPVKVTDALGNETEFSYANGNPELITEIRYPDGSSESSAYDQAGRKIEHVGKDGFKTEFSYDGMDNLLTESTPYGTTSYEYDANQKLLSVTNPKGAKVEYEYNGLGLVTKEKLPGDRVKLKEYGVEGLLSAEQDANGNRTTYVYDGAGRLTTVTDPLGKKTTMTYSKLGNLHQKTTPGGNWTRYTYSQTSLLTSVNEKDLRKTSFSYDANGNQTKVSHSDGTSETRSYDSEDNLSSVVDRGGKTSAYSYDALSQLSKETRPDQSEVNYSYDPTGKMLKADYGDGHIYENSYNLSGQLIESSGPNSATTGYGYDPQGALTSRGPPQSQVGYSHNSYGEISSVSYPSGLQIDYSYDTLGNLEEVKSADEVLASYSYDSSYNLTGSSYANGSAETSQFDALNRLTKITVGNGGGELYARSLELNADSQISKATTNYGGAVKQNKTYQYSPLGTISSVKDELTAKTQKYTYDLVNNLTALGPDSYSYSGASSELAEAKLAGASQGYSYDARGNRTGLTAPSKTAAYSWSQSDRLESVALSPTKTVSYGYDASGLLSSRAVSGSAAESFSWDTASGSIPVLIEDSNFEYVYGAEATPFLQIEKGSAERTYLHGDERNSVVLATDSDGAALWHRDYDEYGAKFTQTAIGETPGSPETRFAYAGEYLDADTGLYNLRARWYDPQTASFLSVDPAINLTGEKYSYGSGNPLSYTDPLGLWSMKDTGTSVAAAVDGFLGFPVAATMMNSISPGSVDSCSALYVGVGTVVGIGSMFIPGIGPAVKIVGLGVKAFGKVAPKLYKYAAAQMKSDRASLGTGPAHGSSLYFGGGTYGDIHNATKSRRASNGVEIHHMPADSMGLSPSRNAGPSVLILKSDHKLTRTYKSKVRPLQKSEAGLPIEEVARRDIRDLLQTPGGKAGYYDQGIRDMLKVPSLKAIDPKEFGL